MLCSFPKNGSPWKAFSLVCMVLSWSIPVSRHPQVGCLPFSGDRRPQSIPPWPFSLITQEHWAQPRLTWASCCTLSPHCKYFFRELRKGQEGAGWWVTVSPLLSHLLNCRDAEMTRWWWSIAECPAWPRGNAGMGCSGWRGAVTHRFLAFCSQTALKEQRPVQCTPTRVCLFTFSLQIHLLFFILPLKLGFRNVALFHLEITYFSLPKG